jgi:RNA polymerase I-specific transcription initiation factor RRN5
MEGTAVHPILKTLPEASLLQPEIMLTLSREIFMNRSASMPSPWPHWSNYVSEIAAEPSIYRTAFNDFHRLVISVTKRLVQTAIVQATSRLRSQRFRVEKGTQPFVKTRDVHSAIDILGLERNASERWRGVPRRCNLRVTVSNTTPQGRRTRDVPWSEVERIMAPATFSSERVESSAEPENFKSRAARSGTPLPIYNLTLSDADADVDEIQQEDMVEDDSDISERFTDIERMPSTHRVQQPRDPTGRYATVPPDEGANEPLQYSVHIEAFDQEASRQGEEVLWELLGMEARPKDDATKADDNLEDIRMNVDETITTLPTDWRQLLKYCAPYEEYPSPVSIAELIANQKPPSPMPASYARAQSTEGPPDDASDASSTLQTRGRRQKLAGEINLHVRGTNAYAALQREGLGVLSRSSVDSSSDRESTVPEEDIPTQSIEAEQGAVEIGDDSDDMDWI